MPGYLRLDAFSKTPVVPEPFEYVIVPSFVDAAAFKAIIADYPKITTSGSFPVDQVTSGRHFGRYSMN